MFSEFKEYRNPEDADYDISSSLQEDEYEEDYSSNNGYDEDLSYELCELIGILEDGEEPPYGLTYEEYNSPTRETINKVKQAMREEQTQYHR